MADDSSTTTSTETEDTSDEAKQQALADAAREANGDDSSEDDDETDDEKFDAAAARRRIDKAQREAKNLRDRIKALEPLAKEAEKRRQGEMSEAQKLTEEKAQLQTQLAELTTANTRRDAAEAAGLSPKFVKFITAAEPDEALAQAKELAKELKAATGEDRKPDLRQGNRGNTSNGNAQNHDDLLRQMARQR